MTRPRARRRRSQSGAVAVEFALVSPVLIVILLATADIGNAIQQMIRLEVAARAGAQIAMTNPTNSAGIQTAALQNLSDWVPVGAQNCAPGGVCVSIQHQCGTSPNSLVSCPGNFTETDVVLEYVSVSVSRPYTPLFIVSERTLSGYVEFRRR
ncbi:TadE family protein [Roseomonas sp. HF4]|uniref:TadE/TadG family type IV pilus assembly protein n=1 Tax=Roseomonas sp. HF4 TaxID=2562313 RepID=UPI0010C13961